VYMYACMCVYICMYLHKDQFSWEFFIVTVLVETYGFLIYLCLFLTF